MESAVSTHPPPGTTKLLSSTRFTTHRASWIERSISSTKKSLAPLRMMEAEDRLVGLERGEGKRDGGERERERERVREGGRGREGEKEEVRRDSTSNERTSPTELKGPC